MREILAQLVKRDAPLLLWITMGSSALLFVFAGYIWNDHMERDDAIHGRLESRLNGQDDKLEKREGRLAAMEAGIDSLNERTIDTRTELRKLAERVRH